MPKAKKSTTKKKPTKKKVSKKIERKVKKTVKKPKKVKAVKEKTQTQPQKLPKLSKYLEAVGRRKTAIARVRLWTRGLQSSVGAPVEGGSIEKIFLVNKKPYQSYFPTLELQQITIASLEKMKCLDRFKVSVIVKGGGIHAQAEAIRHGTARALILFSPDFKKRLKKAGYLTRDARMRERKKFGLKRARRAPQWQKR